MAQPVYECLQVTVERGVAFVTLDHPPLNLFDLALMREMSQVARALAENSAVRVVVLQSADPEFFIAHSDVKLIQELPTTAPPKPTAPGAFQQLLERWRTLPQATIGKVEGRARGGGCELLLALDMRFGALGRAILSQPEIAVGIGLGGGGSLHLPRLIGYGRALEMILGCEDFPAHLAAEYGLLNRVLPPEELTPFVEHLAFRIASFPATAIALAKASVRASELPLAQGLLEEQDHFNQAVATPAARERLTRFMQRGGQTRDVELAWSDLLATLGDEG